MVQRRTDGEERTDRHSGKIVGSSRYYELNEEKREVAIGYTFLSREKWGGSANKELKQLMLAHAFQWVDTVWFHVAGSNIRSQRAMEKIGGQLSHKSTTLLNVCWLRNGSANPARQQGLSGL